MNTWRMLVFALLSTFANSASARSEPVLDDKSVVPARMDHHVHLRSPAILSLLAKACDGLETNVMCSPAYTRSNTVEDLLQAMNAAGIRRARLISTAYQAESPMLEASLVDRAEALRAANDFTVEVARQHPDRLDAFIGVNPIRPTALGEIARWRDDKQVSGIKIHLANSGFDFHRPEHVQALAAVFTAAANDRRRILIHLRNRLTGYGAEEARIFLREILPAARSNPVQIAHAAGWGGIDAATLGSLGAFAEVCAQKRATCAGLTFDLAAIVPEKASDAAQTEFVRLMRRIGIRHFVAASDWPFMVDLKSYYVSLARLPLSAREWRTIAGNVGS